MLRKLFISLLALATCAGAMQKKSGDDLVAGVKSGDVAAVHALLASGVSPDAKDSDGNLALNWAVRFDRPEVTKALLDAGANVNAREPDGDTPLMIAASAGRKSTVETLLAKGARVNDKDKGGHTPLVAATFGLMFKKLPEVLASAFLMEEGAETKDEADALRKSLGEEYAQVVSLLIERGADVNARAEDCGMTALIVASMVADVETVRILLTHGAKVGAKNRHGDTAFVFATMSPERLEREMSDDPTLDPKIKQALLAWVRDTAPQRAEIARLLREAARKR